MTDDKIAITIYLGRASAGRVQQLLSDLWQYAEVNGITHNDKPALGKAVRHILEQFYATDAARLEAGLSVECANCGRTVMPGSEWIEFDAGGVCCRECQQAADRHSAARAAGGNRND